MIDSSIVLVTYGQWEFTERCLHSLQAALGDKLGSTWEVIVVDNHSPDETPQRLQEWSDRVRIELLAENRNFAGGCNVGADLAAGEVLIFLNNDTVVPEGALETLATQALEPGVGAAGCRLLYPDGTIQHAGIVFVRDHGFGERAMPWHVFQHLDGQLSASQATFETDCVTAACLAVRREVFTSVKRFDEGYRNGLEDIDFCLKVRVAGHRIVYRGDATIIHHEGATRGSAAAPRSAYPAATTTDHNAAAFASRWAPLLHQDDELAGLVWDAGLRDRRLDRMDRGAKSMVVIGQPSGIGPAAEEARALLTALAENGHVPGALDVPDVRVVSLATGKQADALRRGLTANLGHITGAILVPSGPQDQFHVQGPHQIRAGKGTVVRLGWPGSSLKLAEADRVLVPSQAVASELAANGLRPAKLRVLPPLVEHRPLGDGGRGALLVLPTHDDALAAAVLEAVADLRARIEIRLLPTVFRRGLEDEIGERLPGVELLGPCSDEGRFAALAGDADLVIAADPSDPFERRALVAASVGTPPLTLSPNGPAADALGGGAVATLAGLARDAEQTLAACTTARHSLQLTIREACRLDLVSELFSDGQ